MSAGRLRWAIVALIAIACILNYVDRQTLSLLAKPVQASLAISDVGYANLVSAVLIAYTLGPIVTAWIIVRIGARRGLGLFVATWSLASAFGGLAQNAWQLGATRFVLGLAEAGNFTAAPVIVRQWFKESERAAIVGIYTAAAMLGGTLAPPLITWLEGHRGWREAFIITGVVGLVWVVVWMLLYRHRDEQAAIAKEVAASPAKRGLSWREILVQRRVWAIVAANALAAPVWYFYLFWFPKYLTDERGVTLAELGRTSWIVYLCAGIGALVGGTVSGLIVRRGVAAPRARLIVMASVLIAAPISALNAFAPPVAVSLAIGAIVGFIHFLWTTNLTALNIDLFDSGDLGKVLGVQGLVSGTAGVLSNYAVAWLVTSLSYRPMFVAMGAAYVVALACAAVVLRDLRRQPVTAAA